MTPETKKYLLTGGLIIVGTSIAVVLYKKVQGAQSAQSGASDQQTQDEYALLTAALESNAYAGQSGGAQSFLPATGVSTPPSLADEIKALEQALGIAPPTVPPAPSPTTGGSSTPPVTPGAPGTPSTTPLGGGQSGGEPVGPIYHGGHPVLTADSPRYETEADYVLEGVHVA